MVRITLRQVEKTFQSKNRIVPVLNGVDLTVAPGEVVAVRGDNGSGKTTLLNILARLDIPDAGTVAFEGIPLNEIRIGYVQQDYTSSLLPWFDALENIAIPLRLLGIKKKERRLRALEQLRTLKFSNISGAAYPHELSGGQKQKIALARATIHTPHLLLLDEPFANLDAHTSRDLQETISEMHEARHPTIIYVSHDLDHSVFLADRVILLDGSPAKIIEQFVVPLPRPRCRELMLREQFAQVRSQIFRAEEHLYAKQHAS